jgi:hypothetical protein
MAALTPEAIASWYGDEAFIMRVYRARLIHHRPIPNYDHPHGPLTPTILGVEISMISLMTLFVAGRFYSRTVLVKGALGVDDWVMVVAFVR